MSRMTQKTNRKIILTLLIAFTAFIGGTLAAPEKAAAEADWCEDVQAWSESELGISVGCGKEEITFSDFEGGFEPPSTEGYAPGLTRVTTVRSFVLTFLNFALSFLGLVAVAIIIYGGFLYVTARGDSEQSDKGKKSIQYALGGIIIILLSFALVNTLITEPFSEGNLQGEGGSLGAAAGGGGGGAQQVGVSLNPMVSQVKTSVTNLVSMYAVYQEVNQEIAAMTTDMNKATTDETLNTVIQFLDSVINKLDNIKPKLKALSSTKIILGESINELALIKDNYQNAKSKKDDTQLENWETDKEEIVNIFDEIGAEIQKDLEEEVKNAKETLGGIKATIPLGELDGQAGLQSSIHVIIDNLLSADYGLDSIIAALPAANEQLKNVLSLYKELYKALASMRTVKAGIAADVTEGNAPLVVTFNMLSSLDPTGQTITDDRIKWDLNGDGKFDDGNAGGICNPTKAGSMSFITCTFTDPGTYQSSVRVTSTEPGKYFDGIATIPVKVSPPTATLKLAIGSGNNDKTEMFEYGDNNLPLFEKKSVKFTLAEAKAGITFDAKDTVGTDGTDKEIVSYYFNFGDSSEATQGSDDQDVEHFYGEPGTYKVVFEVKDNKNKTNRKIFDLIIGSPVARINVAPGKKVLVGQEVFLNGTSSSSESGQIVSYEWSIKGKKTAAVTFSQDEQKQSTLNYVFTKDDTYEITLTVNDSFKDKDSITTFVEVTSQAPISKYTYKVSDTSQPSTLQFFGSKSYDPDGNINDPIYDFQWTIEPKEGFTFIEGDPKSLNPIIQFDQKNEYQVSFLVQDAAKQGKAYQETIVIDNVLDVKWDENQDNSAQLDADGEAKVDFAATSRNGVSYEIDFGDGESEGDDINNKNIDAEHIYGAAGKYQVRLTVFDEEDNDTTITRKVYIGDGTKPIAAIKLFVDGQEVDPEDDQIEVSRKSVITFDASNSKNTDGTGRLLTYSWDFDDSGFSTQKTVTHTYKEIKSGSYKVTLKVADKDDQTKSDQETASVKVVSLEPELSGLSAVPQANGTQTGLVTPIKVKLEAQGATDGDGVIVQYRWYYYDKSNSSDQLGVQITESKQAYLTIGTRGKKDSESTYKFVVEMTDNENNTISSADLLNNDEIPSVKVTNGANEQPTARFKVDRTNISVGESVTFSSEAQDPDGEIISYIWDTEGDGFANNKTTDKATYTHTYKKQAKDGLLVRLKVIDDKYGEATSEPITIYVQSNGEPPKAAFTFDVTEGTIVKFGNNSAASAKLDIKEYRWDFDVASNDPKADSDGDGVKDNDADATSKNPSWEFPDYGLYQVKLTVIDDDGNEDTVTNYVNIQQPTNTDLPKAAFKVTRTGNKTVTFENNSTNPSGPNIVEYIWDFDINSKEPNADSDGDGAKDNDHDSKDKNPGFEYPNIGTYQAKLTVIDSAGAEDTVINVIELAKLPIVNEQTGEVVQPGDGSGTFTDGTTKTALDAKLLSEPGPSPVDNRIHLLGDTGVVTFDFSTSTGEITKYSIDKNIFFDSDGNGVPNDDKNMEVPTPGKWTTDFVKSWGKTVVKLTVYDQHGNSDNVLKEVVFDSPAAANLFTSLGNNLWAALVSLLSFVILAFVLYKKTK